MHRLRLVLHTYGNNVQRPRRPDGDAANAAERHADSAASVNSRPMPAALQVYANHAREQRKTMAKMPKIARPFAVPRAVVHLVFIGTRLQYFMDRHSRRLRWSDKEWSQALSVMRGFLSVYELHAGRKLWPMRELWYWRCIEVLQRHSRGGSVPSLPWLQDDPRSKEATQPAPRPLR